ncbi:ABC transporter ATP-binding protein [Paenarthrobacter sp. CCNWLY172]|uniref:ABC transporter ATP-binding protein n=1 Tax=Micrococcaceae TaxID=1268 RepID=UPI001A9986E7|nr:ABC transporter ATP-binding protein [Arthrobacter sp. D5-1]
MTKHYKGKERPAVDGVSLEIESGEVIAVVGHNGAGKSSLFDMLGGLTRPDKGSVELCVDVDEIGWCPQREIIDWSLTVRQNIALGLELRQKSFLRRGRQDLMELSEAMGLTPYLDQTAETLSGGELRRTQIARAMAGDPPLMILDEPTTGLDPSGISEVFAYLERRRRDGAAAIISTHETSRFSSRCTRVIAMENGSLISDLPVGEFMSVVPQSEDLWDAYLSRVGQS